MPKCILPYGTFLRLTHLLSHGIGFTLALKGAVDGIILSITVLSLADAAAWPVSAACTVGVALLVCWAVYSACREALEIATYHSYYNRERRREAWGKLLSHRKWFHT